MPKLSGINLVIASGAEKIQNCLKESFSRLEANVIQCGKLDTAFVEQLENNSLADVILIDMDDNYEEDDAALDQLLEKIDLPILFHDNNFDDLNDPDEGCGFSEQAINKLAHKLAELVECSGGKSVPSVILEPSAGINEPSAGTTKAKGTEQVSEAQAQLDEWALTDVEAENDNDTEFSDERWESLRAESDTDSMPEAKHSVQQMERPVVHQPLLEMQRDSKAEHAVNVWVLGSSIGGPESLKQFLARIPSDLQVAFVIAQHLGDGFVALMAEQLDRISPFTVKEAVSGDILRHGEAVIVPLENRMQVSAEGVISFLDEPWRGHYKPSIDCVIKDVTESYKNYCGVMIFSGMGADGVLACQNFVERYQGMIWAQTPDSCVISSMPDSVRRANLVSYSGSPEALALKLSVLYS